MASNENGLEINADKTKYMLMSRDQNARRRHSIKNYNSPLQGWKSLNICEQP